MRKKIFLLFSLLLVLSCTSDEIIRQEKTGYYNIYKGLIFRDPEPVAENSGEKKLYDRKWLSQFNQPIILLASVDGKRQATLVALGNYKDILTWVSADGISVSFRNGILIATRGYSEDLLESKHNDLSSIFNLSRKNKEKTYRYLDGKNEYKEITFSCSITIEENITSNFLALKLQTNKIIEDCDSENSKHSNEYYVLPNTDIVLKSKQWVSPSNGYIVCYNYYAFQTNIS